MKLPLPRDIPRRAAAITLALALIAGVVTGREDKVTDSRIEQNRAVAEPATTAPEVSSNLPDLDLDKLNRTGVDKPIENLFALKAPPPPPPPMTAAVAPSPLPPPSPPTAPALPFRYFGKWVEGEKTVLFLWKNNEGHSVGVGDTVDGTYRVESVTDSAVDFIYLPLGTKQTLPITVPN